MAKVTRVGPCNAFIGNPVTAAGAGMTFLGGLRDAVVVQVTPETLGGRMDQSGSNERADSQYVTGTMVEVTIPLLDEEKVKLDAVLPDSEIAAGAAAAAWAAATAYTAGDRVTDSGMTYSATRDHTSATGDVADGAPSEAMSTAWQLDTSVNATLGFGGGSFRVIPEVEVPALCLIPIAQGNVGTNGVEAPEGEWFPGVRITALGQLTHSMPDPGTDDSIPRHAVTFKALLRETDQGGTAIRDKFQVYFRGAPTNIGLTWSLPAPVA